MEEVSRGRILEKYKNWPKEILYALSVMGLCGGHVGHPNLPVSGEELKQIEQLVNKQKGIL